MLVPFRGACSSDNEQHAWCLWEDRSPLICLGRSRGTAACPGRRSQARGEQL